MKVPTTEDVIAVATEVWGENINYIRHRTNKRRQVRMRQIIHYVSRHLTLDSLNHIATSTGHAQHGTVLHSYKKVAFENGKYEDVTYMVKQMLKGLADKGFRTIPPPVPKPEPRLERDSYDNHCVVCGRFAMKNKKICYTCKSKN